MVNKFFLTLLCVSSVSFASQDPTAPLNWQPVAESKAVKKTKHYRVPKLESIVCQGEHSCSAILNGHALAVGEKINGFYLKQVKADYATITRGGKQWKLELFPLEVKQ